MAGSIRKRPDKAPDAFELRVYLGRDPSGWTRHMSKLFHGTKRGAEIELARLVTEQANDPPIVPREPRVRRAASDPASAAGMTIAAVVSEIVPADARDA